MVKNGQQWAACAALIVLGACAAPTSETRDEITVNGLKYVTVTSFYEQNGKTVATGKVLYAGRSISCNTSRPGDCEAVVQRLQSGSTVSEVDNVMDSSTFIVTGIN